ncbi:prepilin-type N-terminal cleavage/methylation domain-containing protein [Mameliella sp. CS4]|uniref:type II secretion system protein n=1 Tax=Mameliella sp. CS4 TaxID=2862329 RepID=UPI001C5F177B|nr:prepilin-type N-terminal cleavage/methylation domain-containing protein [Mameliella sp. CS4]MBW4985851.1 prepilin-type N-terminal cleavage/methylation domain-containing protein [Mameliella sp. CS4]
MTKGFSVFVGSKQSQAGFSLVELSIVLVILGLLTGGILTGQNLIRAAEMRSVITQIQQYTTAAMTFRDKYFANAGDMPNATDFWGVKGGTGDDDACYSVVATGTETCNGNGGGWPAGVGGAVATAQAERFLFWQHLANAGMIEGSYTGVTDSSSDAYVTTAGVNSPQGKIGSSYFGINGGNSFGGGTDSFIAPGGLLFTLRQNQGANNSRSPLYAEEVWNIDKKLDDGRPGTGRVMTHKNGSPEAPGCATTDDESTAEYAVSYTANTCHLRIIQ